ncbi:MAG TPA: DUF924 family protein [Gammaproteobacteria bacterium]
MMSDYQEILAFWFSDRVRPLWFRSTPEFDAELRERYLSTWQAAAAGELESWRESAQGALALTIVLDQFPLNMFRGKAQSFSTAGQALAVAADAVARGLDRELERERLPFLYLPFMHSENIDDQERSVALFEAAGLTENLRFARHHRELIRRFGRFPHRNAILGRSSSAGELAYLASKEAYLG